MFISTLYTLILKCQLFFPNLGVIENLKLFKKRILSGKAKNGAGSHGTSSV